MLLVISDFYEDPTKILDAFAQLRGRGNDIMAMHILDTAELEFPYDGATSFEDMETGERFPCPGYLRDQYRTMIRAHVAELAAPAAASRASTTACSTRRCRSTTRCSRICRGASSLSRVR